MIELILLDVDGTLTDGQIIYTVNGDEMKNFSVKDGLAISSWIKMGGKIAIITGRNSTIVERRAKELGIELIFQGIKDKYSLLLGLCEDLQLGFDQIAAMGDDLNDYKMLKSVGRSFAPADASKHIRTLVDTVTDEKAGYGAVREAIELLIEENGQLEAYLKPWK